MLDQVDIGTASQPCEAMDLLFSTVPDPESRRHRQA